MGYEVKYPELTVLLMDEIQTSNNIIRKIMSFDSVKPSLKKDQVDGISKVISKFQTAYVEDDYRNMIYYLGVLGVVKVKAFEFILMQSKINNHNKEVMDSIKLPGGYYYE